MSKLVSKLSRQIMAAVLSVAMILPNMTVYASEVSDPDSILPVSEVVETGLEENAADEEQPLLTEEENEAIDIIGEEGEETKNAESDNDGSIKYNSKSLDDAVLEAEEPEYDLQQVTRLYNFLKSPYTDDYVGDVTSPDGRLVISGGQRSYNGHGIIMKSAAITIDVYAGETIYIGGCQFNNVGSTVTVNDTDVVPMDTMNQNGSNPGCSNYTNPSVADTYAVNYSYTGTDGEWGKVKLQFSTNSIYVPYIIVAGQEPEPADTEVAANITFDEETKSILDDTDVIKLVNISDSNDEHDITSAKTETKSFNLKPYATYKIVSENPDIEALTADGKSTILVKEEAVAVTVKFTTTVVNPKVTYDIANNLSVTDYTLTLVNNNDTSDTVSLTKADNETVKLKIGATYTISTNSDKLDVLVNGAATLTVGDSLTEITIKVTENSVPTIKRTTAYSFLHGALLDKYGACILKPHDQKPLDFTSRDGLLTIKSSGSCHNDTHGLELQADSTITIHVLGKTEVLIGGCQYSNASALTMVSKPAGEEATEVKKIENAMTSGCFHSDETNVLKFDYAEAKETDLIITTAGKLYVPVIIVNRTEPKPENDTISLNVTLNDGNNALQADDKITLVKVKDNDEEAAPVPIDITDAKGTTKKIEDIPIYTTYKIVSSNPDISATEQGWDDIVTGTEDMDVTIELSSTVVHPMVHVTRSSNIPADANLQLKLVNMAEGSNEEVALVDGQTVKLTIGATYRLECSDAVEAKINNGTRLTVEEGLTEINVNVTAPDTSMHTIDVWDFGAEELTNTATATYNNKLTEDIINGWYPDTVAAGTKDVNLPSTGFETKDSAGQTELYYNPNSAGNHRLRTTNTNLTRTDEKSLTDIDDSKITYKGYIYSNSGKEPKVYMQLAVKAGDIVTFAVSSNGTDSTLNWESPSGSIDGTQTYIGGTGSSGKAQRMTFYAKEDGNYKLYSVNEKLVVARIYRERPGSTAVSGSLTLPPGVSWNDQAKVVFTNTITGQRTEAVVTNNNGSLSYTVSLLQQYSYDISLEGIEGCIMGEKNKLDIANAVDTLTFNLEAITVDLVEVSGSLAALTTADAAKLTMKFVNSEMIYVPSISIDADNVTYSAKLEKDVVYDIVVADVNDYELNTETITASADATDKNIQFTKKQTWPITVTIEGPTEAEASNVELTFTNVNEEGYVYNFTGTNGIELRDGQYAVSAVLEGYTQRITSDLKVDGAAVSKTIKMVKTVSSEPLAYKAEITVGTGKEYATINEALAAVRRMTTRTAEQRVTIAIDPGDYEEMLVVDVPNVTLKNASETPSIDLKNKGVNIDENAVRITSYYGHGYTYYSMGPDCKWDGDLLEANIENGYPSFVNPGSGSTAGSYWNATVVIDASGFQADGIIFENSFNQYVSQKASEDVIVKQASANEGAKARADMEAGDVTVQNKAYVERAAALAIKDKKKEISFNNCKFVGRQDTLYGGKEVTAAFYACSIYGATDYIFGGMTAVFAKCDLVMNTMEDNNDVAYITAAQQTAGRGYLMYNCEVKSTTPGVDTASAQVSKPGYFGRPWQGTTSEAVFYYTIVGTSSAGTSLITPEGWNASLGGAAKAYEYGTYERTENTDNSASRLGWSTVLERPVIDNEAISVAAFLGAWNPFDGKDMTIRLPDGTEISEEDAIFQVIDAPTAKPASDSEVKINSTVTLEAAAGLKVYYSVATGSAPADPTYDDQHLYGDPITLTGEAGDVIYIKVVAVKYNQDGSVNNYSDPITLKYTLKGSGSGNPDEDDSGLTVVLDPEYIPEGGYVYTGNAITPAVIVKNNNIPLTEGVDYTVKYSNNKNANNTKDPNKQAKITVTGIGSFSGKATTTFTIYPKSLAEDEDDENPVVAGAITVVKNKKVAPILVYNGIKLAAKDFSIEGDSKFDVPAADAEAPKVKVTGKGNFKDSREIPVNVVASNSDLKKIAVKVNTNSVDYDGTPKDADITVTSGGAAVTNSAGVEDNYTVVYNTDRTNAGTVKFTVIGLGAYTGSVTKTFKIKPKKATISVTVDLDAGQTTASYEYVSTGVTIPDDDLVVKDGATELTKGVDYKVAYSNNKKVSKGSSTAKCNVTFIGNYKGSAKQTVAFTITPGTISDETVDVVAVDKIFKKAGFYKSAPIVKVKADGSQLKASDYTVNYYLDETLATEMKGQNKVSEAGTKVYVKVTGKGNYANADDTVCATGEYTVCAIPDGAQDLSTAKIEFYVKGAEKKTTKIEYTGKAIEFNDAEEGETPNYELRVMIGKGKNATEVPKDKYEITYANNINKGKATVVITPVDNSTEYVGGKTATFNIVAQKVKTDLLGGLFGGAAPDLSNLIESILTNE